MLLSRIAPLSALLFLSTFTGCSVSAASVEETTSASTDALTTETFTLHDDLEQDPSGRCDIHTILMLSPRTASIRDPLPRGTVLFAHLYEEATGSCKLRLRPDPRDYALLLTAEECGSKIYTAATTLDGTERDIKVSDHRERFCKDLVPAKIVVEERTDSGELRELRWTESKSALPVS